MWLLNFMLSADKTSLINVPINQLNTQEDKRTANYKDGYITRRHRWPTQTYVPNTLNVFIFRHYGRTVLKWILKNRMKQRGLDLWDSRPRRLADNCRRGNEASGCIKCWKFVLYLKTFDGCVTVHHWYNNINSRLDATVIILLIISISSTCFER